jgi:hypothetical protein
MVLSVQKLLGLLGGGALMAAVALGMASPVSATGCQSGGSPWGGGGFCDTDHWADGSYMHCVDVYVMGYGGSSCGRVCPPPPGAPVPPATDMNPRTHC